MLIDARSLPNGHCLEADVCVVGAGAAGLTIAHELGSHARVVVLESGGELLAHATQRLHEGEVSAHPYYALDACRFRVLGGSTTYWGGWCRPLDAQDFERRSWVPHSGWPFTKQVLEPFYRRAQQICRLGPYNYEESAWTPPQSSPFVRSAGRAFQETLFQIQPTRFGEVYGLTARDSRHLDLVLHATALEVRMNAKARAVTEIVAGTLSGTLLTARADVFVLASGGIENARILLSSPGARGRAVGNDHDLVGRFFSDHLHVPLGLLRPKDGAEECYRVRSHDGVTVRGALASSEAYRKESQGLGFGVTFHNADDPHDVLSLAQTSRSYLALHQVVRALRRGRKPERALHHLGQVMRRSPEVCRLVYRRLVRPPARTLLIGGRAEQAPNPESRVTLSTTRDALGVRKVQLAWRLSSADLESVTNAQSRLAEALGGRDVDMFPAGEAAGGGWRAAIAGGAHHMGTTRMHPDPREGVVDEHCRIHNTANLFVAGSSVFPVGGWAPPTLTIVALAVRLADHLKGSAQRADP